jgi:predicted ribosome quality control (RQC) complex YloA/Tae2 family protein
MSLFRFSSHETKLEIDCLQDIIGMRIGNIHQTEKTLLIKFWKLGVSRHLLIENGIRFHLTEFPREKPKTPPDVCCRLRKWLRFRRLDDIIQPGNDRAVYFCFGDMRLCLELFDAGNIILFQASDNRILALQRYHVIQRESGKTVIGVNQLYTPEQFRDYRPPTDEAVHTFLSNIPEKEGNNQKLRTFLSRLFPFHRHEFFLHAITVAGIRPVEVTVAAYVYEPAQVDLLIAALRPFDELLLSKPPPRPPRPPLGPDGARPEPPSQPEEPVVEIPKPAGFVYALNPKDKFLCGVHLAHWDAKRVQRFDTFDAACDQFWSVAELQVAHREREQVAAIPQKKVASVQRNFEKKKKQLQQEIDTLNRVGAEIQRQADDVEACRQILSSYISQHLRWDDIRAAIRGYQEAGDERARMIDKVEFEKGQFWVLLQTEKGNIERVLIDLRKSAYANASAYFDRRGPLAEKLQRTEAKEAEVVRKVDKTAQATKKKVNATIQDRRKTWWFERFHWFITSENYLVIAGRDKIQNEVLVKHYLRKDDIYLHADIAGAASVVIKNPTGRPVSPISIDQAAQFTVARSNAWKSDEACQCFWVYPDQVRKTIPGASTAPTGSFYIVGEKHRMTMTMPQMALGILFHVTEDHVAAHSEDRRIRVDSEEDDRPQSPETPDEPVPAAPPPPPPPPVEEEDDDDGEEDDGEEEELTDEELARIALEEPERADVARRRKERAAKRKARRERKARGRQIEPEVAEVMESEGIPIDLDVEGINGLTGVPCDDDEFYAAYTMVAPLSAMVSYKFRVKFAPGETKKGKVWPILQNYFCGMKGTPPEQIALMRLIPETDVVNQLPFSLKLALSGAAQKKAQQSKGGKKGKKK